MGQAYTREPHPGDAAAPAETPERTATSTSAARRPVADSVLADGTLRPKNLKTASGRTSVRLEDELWDAYDEVCRANGLSRNRLAIEIDRHRAEGLPFTAAIRVFLIGYFRSRTHLRDLQAADALVQAFGAIGARGAIDASGPIGDER